jgi:hypothetical protein
MLKLLSNLNILQRVELTMPNWSDTTLKQGAWIGLGGITPASKGLLAAYPIWTESNRNNTYGFTPDAVATGKLTLLVGTHRAMTDWVTTSGISVGSPLAVETDGTLGIGTMGTHNIVAYCEALTTSYVYMGTTYSNVITYITA